MKLPPVEYEAPTTVAEAIDLLAEHGDEASVLAGGQSLLPLLALRLARPEVLIDINRVDELSGVSATNGHVTIGAMTREYAAAIPDDGRLLLVEAIIPDDDSPHLTKDLDIRLITILPGGGRTESEYARLLAESGFRPEPAAPLARVESVMVAIPAS